MRLNDAPTRPPRIYLRHRMTVTFDLLIHKADCFTYLPVDHVCQLASKSVHSFSKYRVYKFRNRRMDGQTDKQTDNMRKLCLSLPVWPGRSTNKLNITTIKYN